MRPRNAEERAVNTFSERLPYLTMKQSNWIIGQERERSAIEYGEKRKMVVRHEYYAIVTTYGGWQVVRHFLIKTKTTRKGFTFYYLSEVSQRWMRFDEGGRLHLHIFEKQKGMCWQWRAQPFAVDAALSLKGWNTDKWWRGGRSYFRCNDENIYPDRRFTQDFKERGLAWYLGREDEIELYCDWTEKGGVEQTAPLALDKRKVLSTPLLCYLPTRAETLYKIGLKDFADEYLQSPYFSEKINDYWRTILVALRHGFDFGKVRIWDYFDYLRELQTLGLDLHSPRYVAPKDFLAAHAEMSARCNNLYRKQQAERERQQYLKGMEIAKKEEAEYAKKIRAYAGIVLTDGSITIRPLQTVLEFLDEGTAMHHCVYSGAYYKKAHTLVLTARGGKGERLETIEVNTYTGKILQSRGFGNIETPHHKEIVDLVNRNMGRLCEMKAVAV